MAQRRFGPLDWIRHILSAPHRFSATAFAHGGASWEVLVSFHHTTLCGYPDVSRPLQFRMGRFCFQISFGDFQTVKIGAHIVCDNVLCMHALHASAEGNLWFSVCYEKGSSNFPLCTVGALCCNIEEDDTRERSTGSLQPRLLLICLKRCFSVHL